MKRHVKLFLEAHGYPDWIPCAVCGATAVDIHHIEPKGMGGRRSADVIANLIALCRECHTKAHANLITKEELYEARKPF